MIENRLLRHALALGEHGCFARAAEALHLTQPTLSRSIALLERILEVKLFDRTTKGVVPTAFGRSLIERGGSILRDEASLRREMRLLAGLEEGELAVSAGPYLAEGTVAVAIGRLSRSHPRLRIKCLSADPVDVVRAVLAEAIDVGVAAVPQTEHDARLKMERLATERAFIACRPGHPLAREVSVTLARALEFPLVTTVLRGPLAALSSMIQGARQVMTVRPCSHPYPQRTERNQLGGVATAPERILRTGDCRFDSLAHLPTRPGMGIGGEGLGREKQAGPGGTAAADNRRTAARRTHCGRPDASCAFRSLCCAPCPVLLTGYAQKLWASRDQAGRTSVKRRRKRSRRALGLGLECGVGTAGTIDGTAIHPGR